MRTSRTSSRANFHHGDRRDFDDSTIELKDLKHDLENQLIKIKQNLENLRSKAQLPGRPLSELYEELCAEHPGNVAATLIFIDRLTYQMFCEMACVTILDGKSEKIRDYKNKYRLAIYTILLRVLLLYGEEMRWSDIHYEFPASPIEWGVSEYVFSAIIVKIIENCTKYCRPHSTLDIRIQEDSIIFSMQSLKIEYTERTKIFENNFSGRHAKKAMKHGSGKWLYHAKRLAEFHNLDLYVIPGTTVTMFEGNAYTDNAFVLGLRR